jgi:ketosteroid isomerase-like protein
MTTHPTTDAAELDDLLAAWTAAERDGDAAALDDLLTDDFVGIGPVGFVLPKAIWVTRHEMGLSFDELELRDVSTHRYGDAAIAVAQQHSIGTSQAGPTFPETRVAITAVRDDDRLRIAGIQYSFIAGAPGSPV